MGNDSSIKSLTEEEIEEVADKTDIPLAEVKEAYKDFEELCSLEQENEISENLFTMYFTNKTETRNISSQFVRQLFQAFDRDRNDKLNFFEFLVGLTFFKSDDHFKNLKVFFRLFDLNNDKFIKANEIELVLKTLDKATNEKFSFYNLIKDLDLNNDQQIDESEFIHGIVNNSNYQKFLKQIQE